MTQEPPKSINKDITPHGFNLKDASLDEKMEYLNSLYKKMNRNFAVNMGISMGVRIDEDPNKNFKNLGADGAKAEESGGRTGSVNADDKKSKDLLAPQE